MLESVIRSFGKWISTHDWSELNHSCDLTDQCDYFLSILRSHIDSYFPLQKAKCHSSDKPWMTATRRIKHLICELQRAFHKGDSANWKRLRQAVYQFYTQVKKKHNLTCAKIETS